MRLRPTYLLALLLSVIATAAHGTERWRVATGYRAESFHTRNLVQFAAEVDEATRGALKIEIVPNNTLLRLPEIFDGVRGGKAEGGEVIMSQASREIPLAGADSVPFITGGYDDARRMWALQRPLVERQFAARGLKLLYAVPWPPQGLYSKTPIRSVADLRGTRMRTYNATTVRIAERFGATPVDVPMVDVQKALADGRIDNMITSAVTGVENAVWSHLRHYYDINAWIPKNVVFVRLELFERLPAASREALLRTAQAAEVRGWALSAEAARASVRELAARGIKVERLPDDFERRLQRIGESFAHDWVRTVGSDATELFLPYFFQALR